MDTTQINQNILSNLINALAKNELDYTDATIFNKKLITFLSEHIKRTPQRTKYDHLIKNRNEFILDCVPYTDINVYRKRGISYNGICSEKSGDLIKYVCSLFYSRYIYSNKSKRIYTALTLECEFELYKGSNFDRLLSLFKKIRYKTSVKKLTLYLKFKGQLNEHSKCLMQLIRAIALNFNNVEQLKIFSLKNISDKWTAKTFGRAFVPHENVRDNSDYDTMVYIVRTCAKYLSKLKLLHYCSRYNHVFLGTNTRKYVTYFNLKYKQFNQNYFKVQYDNTLYNIEMSKILFRNIGYRT